VERIVSIALGVLVAYLFNTVFDQVSYHSGDLRLSDPHYPADGLVFDGRIPGGLEDVDLACGGDGETWRR
jgi:hypothetical protein